MSFISNTRTASCCACIALMHHSVRTGVVVFHIQIAKTAQVPPTTKQESPCSHAAYDSRSRHAETTHDCVFAPFNHPIHSFIYLYISIIGVLSYFASGGITDGAFMLSLSLSLARKGARDRNTWLPSYTLPPVPSFNRFCFFSASHPGTAGWGSAQKGLF